MHPALIAAIPGVIALAGKGVDAYRTRIETRSRVEETAIKWVTAERAAKYSLPLVAVSGAGLATYDYFDRRQRMAQLERVESAATEAGDIVAAAAARSERLDLARENGFVERIFDLSGRVVDGVGRIPPRRRRARLIQGETVTGETGSYSGQH